MTQVYRAKAALPAHYVYVGPEPLMFRGAYAQERALAAAAILDYVESQRDTGKMERAHA